LAYDDDSIILDSTGTHYDEFVSKFSGRILFNTDIALAYYDPPQIDAVYNEPQVGGNDREFSHLSAQS